MGEEHNNIGKHYSKVMRKCTHYNPDKGNTHHHSRRFSIEIRVNIDFFEFFFVKHKRVQHNTNICRGGGGEGGRRGLVVFVAIFKKNLELINISTAL